MSWCSLSPASSKIPSVWKACDRVRGLVIPKKESNHKNVIRILGGSLVCSTPGTCKRRQLLDFPAFMRVWRFMAISNVCNISRIWKCGEDNSAVVKDPPQIIAASVAGLCDTNDPGIKGECSRWLGAFESIQLISTEQKEQNEQNEQRNESGETQ
jgi:hypothetical protein